MNATVIRCRKTSLSLIVIAVLNHGHLHPDYTGALPGGSGLTRMVKDLQAKARGARPNLDSIKARPSQHPW
jgi:hypothetical protein